VAEKPARREAIRISCGGCPTTWTGEGRAHCSKCHRLFSSVSTFDRHRSMAGPHGTCLDPETVTNGDGIRLLFFRNGMWCGPEMTDQQKAAAFGRGDAA
jgi:hypothetical protein